MVQAQKGLPALGKGPEGTQHIHVHVPRHDFVKVLVSQWSTWIPCGWGLGLNGVDPSWDIRSMQSAQLRILRIRKLSRLRTRGNYTIPRLCGTSAQSWDCTIPVENPGCHSSFHHV